MCWPLRQRSSICNVVAAAQRLRAAGQYAEGSFRSRIADIYRDGAGFIIAADLQRFIAQSKGDDAKTNSALDRLGITNLKYFIAEIKEDQGKSFNRATLSFSDTSHGMASWLAAPGPMGALEFISPDANVVAAFVVKEPVALVDDLMSALNAVDPKFSEHLDEVPERNGAEHSRRLCEAAWRRVRIRDRRSVASDAFVEDGVRSLRSGAPAADLRASGWKDE